MRLKKGDTVKVIRGKDRGKTGAVAKVFPRENLLSVEGVNLYKKRSRPKRQRQKGETVMVLRPLSVSNVMLICPVCNKPTRLGFRIEGGRKVRYCKKCSASI